MLLSPDAHVFLLHASAAAACGTRLLGHTPQMLTLRHSQALTRTTSDQGVLAPHVERVRLRGMQDDIMLLRHSSQAHAQD